MPATTALSRTSVIAAVDAFLVAVLGGFAALVGAEALVRAGAPLGGVHLVAARTAFGLQLRIDQRHARSDGEQQDRELHGCPPLSFMRPGGTRRSPRARAGRRRHGGRSGSRADPPRELPPVLGCRRSGRCTPARSRRARACRAARTPRARPSRSGGPAARGTRRCARGRVPDRTRRSGTPAPAPPGCRGR